jgi:hypothetical protein
MAYISFQPQDYFNTKLWTGNSTNSTAITGVGFQPDMVWIKNRSTTDNHAIFDAIRGATYRIYPNANDAQIQATNSLHSFDSDGFTLNDGGDANGNGENIVGWNWKANGAGSSNTDGSVTSTVSVSTTSGFSICKFDATGSTMTFGHGLGVKPAVMFVKRTDSNSNGNWIVYHKNVGATKFLTLNDTSAETTASTRFGDTEPTSLVATVGSELLSGGTYIAYCFAQKSGFSSMGSYVGNGSTDGTFVYTGFAPAFIITKITSGVDSWFMYDNKRSPFNVRGKYLVADGTGTDSNADAYDFLSNGFKVKSTATSFNGNGSTYVYMAFAEAPLVSSNGVPAVAR